MRFFLVGCGLVFFFVRFGSNPLFWLVLKIHELQSNVFKKKFKRNYSTRLKSILFSWFLLILWKIRLICSPLRILRPQIYPSLDDQKMGVYYCVVVRCTDLFHAHSKWSTG
jgi:hypothetical protein